MATYLRARAYFTFPRHSCIVVKQNIRHSQLSLKKRPSSSSSFQIRSSSINNNNQFFEDRSEGIICYRDEKGEIVCEGYDEGPRFHQNTTLCLSSSHLRDMEIMNLLQQNWIQIARGSEVYQGDLGFILQEADINSNGGFNTFQ